MNTAAAQPIQKHPVARLRMASFLRSHKAMPSWTTATGDRPWASQPDASFFRHALFAWAELTQVQASGVPETLDLFNHRCEVFMVLYKPPSEHTPIATSGKLHYVNCRLLIASKSAH